MPMIGVMNIFLYKKHLDFFYYTVQKHLSMGCYQFTLWHYYLKYLYHTYFVILFHFDSSKDQIVSRVSKNIKL